MRIAVCFNRVPEILLRGEEKDRISEEGAEHEAASVHSALAERGFDAVLVPLGGSIPEFLGELSRVAPDAVFNLCEGFWGDSHLEMQVAGLFPLLSLSSTGSGPFALGLTQDKVLTKTLLEAHGVPTPAWRVVAPGQTVPDCGGLAFPLFVKPRSEDASLGIGMESVVQTAAELEERVAYIHATYAQDALIEAFIDGREFNVALLGHEAPVMLPPSEIVFAGHLGAPIVTYEGKWEEESDQYTGTLPRCPAPLEPAEEAALRGVAERAYVLCGLRDYGRVDIRMAHGVPYVLEVNANPDISPTAGLARSARVGGIPYEDLIERIVRDALARKYPA